MCVRERGTETERDRDRHINTEREGHTERERDVRGKRKGIGSIKPISLPQGLRTMEIFTQANFI